MSRSKYSSALLSDSWGLILARPNLTIYQHWPYGPLWMVNGILINMMNDAYDGWENPSI
jgi:hypothetical protein